MAGHWSQPRPGCFTGGMDALQVVAEPRRREILRLLWDRELSAGTIASHFDVSFPAVSQHLGVLQQAGFVTVRKAGTRRLYRADRAALGDLAATLERLWTTQLDTLAELAEDAEGGGR
jgi:DNA-binding transcriptional ArsR family regulator